MLDKDEVIREITKFKEEHIKAIADLMIKQGHLVPMMTLFVYSKEKKKFVVTNFVIPGEVMNSSSGKDLFALLAPKLMESLSSQGLVPICFSWSSEAWVRKAEVGNKTREEVLEKYQELPKQEALIVYFETQQGTTLHCKYITRDGKAINASGDLQDQITLTDDAQMNGGKDMETEGRFAHLFQKYMDIKKDDQASKN